LRNLQAINIFDLGQLDVSTQLAATLEDFGFVWQIRTMAEFNSDMRRVCKDTAKWLWIEEKYATILDFFGCALDQLKDQIPCCGHDFKVIFAGESNVFEQLGDA